MPEVITSNLDLWSTALLNKSTAGRGSNGRQVAYGIKKLRELILELAVHGKLVPQEPTDEPASVLLTRILEENARLLQEKGRKTIEVPKITEGEIKFELPIGWEYVRNSNLFRLRKGKKPKNISESQIGLPYLDIEALDRGNILRFTDDDKCPRATEEDLLVVCDGSRSGLVLDGKNGVIGSTLAVIDTPEFIQPFIKLLFIESYERLNSTMKGAAIPHLDNNSLLFEIVGLPPLKEQHRIVAKVDELMALCDQLEQQQTHSIAAHQTLVETVLATLVCPTAMDDVQDVQVSRKAGMPGATGGSEENAGVIFFNHFDTLFTTDHSIDQLKQTILQLAVTGKLVPQDPIDEPASMLLEKIAEEKARLVKEGKIKKEKPLPALKGDGKPFELPKGWAWSRLPEIGELARGKSKHRPRNDPKLYSNGTIPMVQTGDVSRADPFISSHTALYNEIGLSQSRLWPKGAMCITIAANIAETGILAFDACFPDSVVGFIPFDEGIDVKYFEYFMRTAKSHLEDFAPSTAQKNINLDILGQLLVPLPPARELGRIVAKVDELMALCDEFKARLADTQTTQIHLADAIVEQAVA
jgi:type I restriction enzyme S subunit